MQPPSHPAPFSRTPLGHSENSGGSLQTAARSSASAATTPQSESNTNASQAQVSGSGVQLCSPLSGYGGGFTPTQGALTPGATPVGRTILPASAAGVKGPCGRVGEGGSPGVCNHCRRPWTSAERRDGTSAFDHPGALRMYPPSPAPTPGSESSHGGFSQSTNSLELLHARTQIAEAKVEGLRRRLDDLCGSQGDGGPRPPAAPGPPAAAPLGPQTVQLRLPQHAYGPPPVAPAGGPAPAPLAVPWPPGAAPAAAPGNAAANPAPTALQPAPGPHQALPPQQPQGVGRPPQVPPSSRRNTAPPGVDTSASLGPAPPAGRPLVSLVSDAATPRSEYSDDDHRTRSSAVSQRMLGGRRHTLPQDSQEARNALRLSDFADILSPTQGSHRQGSERSGTPELNARGSGSSDSSPSSGGSRGHRAAATPGYARQLARHALHLVRQAERTAPASGSDASVDSVTNVSLPRSVVVALARATLHPPVGSPPGDTEQDSASARLSWSLKNATSLEGSPMGVTRASPGQQLHSVPRPLPRARPSSPAGPQQGEPRQRRRAGTTLAECSPRLFVPSTDLESMASPIPPAHVQRAPRAPAPTVPNGQGPHAQLQVSVPVEVQTEKIARGSRTSTRESIQSPESQAMEPTAPPTSRYESDAGAETRRPRIIRLRLRTPGRANSTVSPAGTEDRPAESASASAVSPGTGVSA
eukprot:TRINITY_DN15494_c0_g1_i1.p1 TRINITY_DN15494_c0_g1~~TRINITY_DN15494_c0_g1_i1.p1  ORF type:complete len:819 (+),score=31.71 TRINITY_DN15494_c0_g1_i1:366-2459(+)